jgi:hypothetical protein
MVVPSVYSGITELALSNLSSKVRPFSSKIYLV